MLDDLSDVFANPYPGVPYDELKTTFLKETRVASTGGIST